MKVKPGKLLTPVERAIAFFFLAAILALSALLVKAVIDDVAARAADQVPTLSYSCAIPWSEEGEAVIWHEEAPNGNVVEVVEHTDGYIVRYKDRTAYKTTGYFRSDLAALVEGRIDFIELADEP